MSYAHAYAAILVALYGWTFKFALEAVRTGFFGIAVDVRFFGW